MKWIAVQMLDQNIHADWFKAIVKRYVKAGAALQIRCWNEEADEIEAASKYGAIRVEHNETCIDGVVTAAWIDELLLEVEPTDKAVYNKMTRYFTIRAAIGDRVLESSHYGTELYLTLPEQELDSFYEILLPYPDAFSTAVGEI